MLSASGGARLAAALMAALAWTGLAMEFAAALPRLGSMPAALWAVLRYFTITTNLIVAAIFTALALARTPHPRLLAGTALAIALVGIVYQGVLRGQVPMSPGGPVADLLLHALTPLLVPLYWLAFARKGALRWRDPALWALYPLAYLAYALARGAADGLYAYPFIDAPRIGWPQVGRNVASITAGFLAAGVALVALDRAWGRRSASAAD